MAISTGTAGTISSRFSAASARATGGRRGVNGGKNRNPHLMEQYRTLRVHPGASEKEVKKSFRQLALQYHPDVCKRSDCGTQFHRINEAYDIVISSLRKSEEEEQLQEARQQSNVWVDEEQQMQGIHYESWDLWEEWMGWEGASTRDYSSHINPYI